MILKEVEILMVQFWIYMSLKYFVNFWVVKLYNYYLWEFLGKVCGCYWNCQKRFMNIYVWVF